DAAPDLNRFRTNPDRVRLEPREVEQLIDQGAEALALVEESAPKIVDLLSLQLAASQVKGRADPVDDRCRRSQLVRCKGDEVRLQLVEVAELRLRERTLEEGRHQHADRPEQLCGVRIQLERLPAV